MQTRLFIFSLLILQHNWVVGVAVFSFSVLKAEELSIFNLDQAETSKHSFIDISDWRVIPEDKIKDDLKIKPSKRYRLKKNKENDFDYHKLSYKKSAKILKISKIMMNHKIFIYNLESDKTTSFKIKNKLPLLAHQNPYGSGEQGVDYYYGFEIKYHDYPIKPDDYRDKHLVYIGKQNPFNTKAMERIIWKKVSNDHFPVKKFLATHKLHNLDERFEEHKYSDGYPYYIKTSYKQDSYTFAKDNISYDLFWFTRDKITFDDNSQGNHSLEYSYLFQAHKNDEKILFERLVKGHEGFDVRPFKEETASQWIGKLFKQLPPVLFNSNESYSFGCNSIYVIDSAHNPINLLCNNRH